MKTLSQRTPLLFIFTIFFVLVICPSHVFGARVTGEQNLVTTTDGKTAEKQDRVARTPAQPPVVQKPQPAGKKADDPRSVTIDFNDVDIKVFIKFMSELTGRNFVIDKAVRGNVTIISPTKISLKEAYKVFESVLEVHGFAAIPAGDIVKIIPVRDAREKNIETRLKREAITPEDKIITQIIALKYASPDEMRKVLTPMVSKSSVILSYTPTGMLIVTDLLSNIKRLLKIIEALDTEGIEEQISVISVAHASSQDVAKSLSLIFQQGARAAKGAIGSEIKIVADDRTNTIITVASENDTFRIKELVKLLDQEVPRGEARIRVHRLQNADAEELTKVLMNIPTKSTQPNEKGKMPVLSKDIQIVPDKATNTLIITAAKQEYLVLQGVIEALDIPRPMVYIEALLMEVNVDKNFNLGAEWVGGDYLSTTDGRTKIYGGAFQSGGITPGPSDGSTVIGFPAGFSVGVLGETISIGGLEFPNLGAIFQAYQKDKDVHILSTPQILTLDNEEAEIYAGENRPYQTRAETSSANVDYSTYEYKDVGATLKITPQISQERFVRLNVYQEVTKLASTTGSVDRPTTLKRTAKTAVVIKDGNTIVIGGLVGEDITTEEWKVPCLGNMPLLGWLFKYQSETRNNTNLFIFITPHIVENPAEATAIYKEKKDHIDKVEDGVIKSLRRKYKDDK